MVKMLGLEQLSYPENKDRLVEYFMEDFKTGLLNVYSINSIDERTLLAELQLMDDGISYNWFEARIDLFFQGRLKRKGNPVCYHLSGSKLLIKGRCSVIMNVCGADLLMNKSSFECLGQLMWQKYTIDMHKVFKSFRFDKM